MTQLYPRSGSAQADNVRAETPSAPSPGSKGTAMRKATQVSLLLVFCAAGLTAQGTFVYTNDDGVPNSISAFTAAANGALSPVPGSPFLTGGNGTMGGLFAANRITTAVVKNSLYAANRGSNTVSAFSINAATGFLTPVPGSPFATGGAPGSGSLAATSDNKFLIATNANSLTVYAVAANGSLSPVAGSPFPLGTPGLPGGIKVTPDGKFLAVALVGSDAVAMFNISATGGLTPVIGSPFPSTGAAGVDCNCASNRLFVGEATSIGDKVDVFNISPAGALSPVAGSPFIGPGINSNVPVLSPDDTKLFVSNQVSNTVTVFAVTPNGSLSVVPGSPFSVPGAFVPSGMATNRQGTLLYVASLNNAIDVFTIAPGGALTSVPGSPFSNVPGFFGLLSLTAFPPKTCCPAPVIAGISATPSVLWPPDHKFVDVKIDDTVTAPCPSTCILTVSSSEPVNATGDGDTSPDWQIIDAHHVLLRAEREGSGDGRTYTITITCTNDLNKESSTKTVTVFVPHDRGK